MAWLSWVFLPAPAGAVERTLVCVGRFAVLEIPVGLAASEPEAAPSRSTTPKNRGSDQRALAMAKSERWRVLFQTYLSATTSMTWEVLFQARRSRPRT